jgi:urea transport system substrate-binding protein
MAELSACPDIQQLMRLVLGNVPAAEVERLSHHLLACRSCLDTLHGLNAEDTLIRQLQAQAAAADRSVQDMIDSVIRRLRESSGEPAQDANSGQTAALAANQDRAHAEESLDFLLEPHEADELGRLGIYRVLKVLGSGGMGLVLLAEDVHLQRLVALKVLRPQFVKDLAARQRFLREARAAAALKHDHVVTIYQVGQENEVPFLAMEFLEGESLQNRLDRDGKLPLTDVLRIGREIAEGLAAAHERNLIHRDIKPANVWLEASTSRIKILDFGLARPAEGNVHLTGTGLVLGTPQYMAPEQARGEALDPRCDLFSLGCVCYRMCSGQSPFGGTSVMAVLTALAVEDPKPLAELDPELPLRLADLVTSLLAKRPENRPPSARSVVEAIRALESEGMPAPSKESGATIRKGPSRTAARRARGSRSRLLIVSAAVALLLVGGVLLAWRPWDSDKPLDEPAGLPTTGTPIKVGILHSRTGTMAISEKPVIEATLLAIEIINEKGGILGRRVEAIVEDGCSDWPTFARKAEKLVTQDKVCTVFGCWTSASRKTVKPIFEKHNHLLFYPVQYEGLEQSPNIVYLGAAPNQQLIPAVKWCCTFLKKKRLFLVGSDYVFPRAAHAIIHDQASAVGAQIVGEEYLLLGGTEPREIIAKIQASQPDIILNTINGDSNVAFFRALRGAGISAAKIPTISFSITEEELGSLGAKDLVGDYAAWNYFQSIDRPQNHDFVRRFQARFGAERITTDPMEAAYSGVHFWAQAVSAAGKNDANAIRQAVKGLSFEAPQGRIRIDADTQHCSKFIRIGRIQDSGRFKVVYASDQPIQPVPYPPTRARAAWDELLTDLHLRWGGQWANPGKE